MLSVKEILKRLFLIGILFLLSAFPLVSQQLTENQVKTGLIFSFTKYFTWEKENQIDTFKIGIYGDEEDFNQVLKSTEKQKIKNKPVKVFVFKSIADIAKTQILVISYERNYFIKDIIEIIKGQNTLLITDRCDYKRYVMANFFNNANNQVQFEINSRNIEEAGLKTSPKLVLLGGSEIDVRKLYVETEKSLMTAKEQVENFEKELAAKQTEISSLNVKLKNLYSDIETLQDKILMQRNELNELSRQTNQQQRELNEKTKILNDQRDEIGKRELQLHAKDREMSIKQTQIEEYSEVLSKQRSAIKEGQDIINKQEITLSTQTDRIRLQQNFLILMVILVAMTLALVFFIYNNYRINRKKNLELQKVNNELNISRDEISHQASLLEIKNLELEKLSVVASKTDNAVIIMDEKGDFEWVNEGFKRLYGYDLEHFIELKGKNLLEASSYPYIREILEIITVDKKSATYEAPYVNASGYKIWVHTTLTPIFDESGNIRKLILIDSNITSLKEAEIAIIDKNEEIQRQSEELYEQAEHLLMLNQELEIKKSKLEETLKKLKSTQTQLVESEKMVILGQLTAGIAHEINNPINFINSGVEGIKMAFEQVRELLNKYDSVNSNNIKEKLEEIEKYKTSIDYPVLIEDINQLTCDIRSGVNRTIEIIKGLRTFTRLDESDLKTIDLNENIDSTLIILRNKYNNRIEIHKDYGIIPNVECFPGKINQLLLNILVNAIQAIKNEGEIFISTKLVTKKDDENILISIRDTGMGMTEEIKKKIFEPFFTTKEAGEGTGLGLSITYSIIENHSGKVIVDTKPGAGTTFKIYLPVVYKKKELPLSYLDNN